MILFTSSSSVCTVCFAVFGQESVCWVSRYAKLCSKRFFDALLQVAYHNSITIRYGYYTTENKRFIRIFTSKTESFFLILSPKMCNCLEFVL